MPTMAESWPTEAQVEAATRAIGTTYWGSADDWPEFEDAARDALLAAFPEDPRVSALPRPEDGCACIPHEQSVDPGYVEYIWEYDPACPEHSEHLYDPRSGVWIFRDPAKNAEWEADHHPDGADRG
jgi:hypothetical protein